MTRETAKYDAGKLAGLRRKRPVKFPQRKKGGLADRITEMRKGGAFSSSKKYC